ncbi:hypothetical protein RGUI_2716 [Rhodovulum sp. P5]|nr:hypothetical protein RGUI_2716 [Rhodovulum sp. P5]
MRAVFAWPIPPRVGNHPPKTTLHSPYGAARMANAEKKG